MKKRIAKILLVIVAYCTLFAVALGCGADEQKPIGEAGAFSGAHVPQK